MKPWANAEGKTPIEMKRKVWGKIRRLLTENFFGWC